MNALSTWPSASVWAHHAIVASGHPLASQAGLRVLASGGSAADAALAMALATAVVMPDMCGLGGEGFALYSQPQEAVQAFIGTGSLPAAYNESALIDAPADLLPLFGGASIAIPGAASFYRHLSRRLGRLAFSEVAAPAILLARTGFPVDRRLHQSLAGAQQRIGGDPAVAQRFYPNGRPLAEGDLLIQPELARSLEALVEKGESALYQGRLAEAMVSRVAAAGGFLASSDLLRHTTREAPPLALQMDESTIFVTPPPSQGFITLEALAILSSREWPKHWREDPEAVHALIEALKQSFVDRRRWAGDPEISGFDAAGLLADEWIGQRRRELGPRAARMPLGLTQGDTTSMVAADANGNVISFIHSLGMPFGSGVYVPEGGFFLNNRAGRSFNRVPGHPNQAQGGKRPIHTLIAYLVQRGGDTVMAGNTMGGDGQPQWNACALLDVLRGGCMPHEAVALPRLTISPATDAHTLKQPARVAFEARFSPAVLADLEGRGHAVDVVGPWAAGGSLQLVQKIEGQWAGASDPRGIGQTLGY